VTFPPSNCLDLTTLAVSVNGIVVITSRSARSAAMPLLFLLTNGFFAQQGRHVAPINVKVGTGERTAVPLPLANFHVYQGKSKFRILVRNLYLRGDSFAIFLENSQCLYTSIGSFQVFSLVAFEGQTPKL